MASIGDTFKPGDLVPESGIYDVIHDQGHTVKHQVTVIAGRKFPPCRNCGHGVRFRAAQLATHIDSHYLF